jgi:hypothetical protein
MKALEHFCPYCKELLIRNSWTNSLRFNCFSHKPCEVEFSFCGDGTVYYVKLIKYSYYIYMYPIDNKMSLWRDSEHITGNLSIDPNLTPENFEQKIKTYLNFR